MLLGGLLLVLLQAFHIQPSAPPPGAKPIGFNLGAGDTVNAAFARLTRKPLPANVLQDAFSRMEPSLAPVPSALATAAAHAKEPASTPTPASRAWST
ncbi:MULTISPECIES: hypothetical protein [Myxococcus]|uniref:hypothetical protein n=1 Tax=Myxococcus TaxID=32 RepID=UPI00030814B8|nr:MULTISPECIES: hypothetical protein [Myxococcus]QZZ49308.1 hypothetical protein MyxoNM_08860 [Myxococcus xanthus]UYI16396.1 hypothetical protein N3T43_08785 [Myxococcus xanthus]UYI23758.1 hypothetical protein N1129_08785 [Myxococcus xanthus]SDY26843.1 hypothetical protein SAMN05444383_12914 [Myxococcus xanthus]